MNIRIIILFLGLVFVGYSCDIKDKSAQSENNIDAARNFIRSALDGKFNDARSYMLQDSLNNNYLDVAERSYKNAHQSATMEASVESLGRFVVTPNSVSFAPSSRNQK